MYTESLKQPLKVTGLYTQIIYESFSNIWRIGKVWVEYRFIEAKIEAMQAAFLL